MPSLDPQITWVCCDCLAEAVEIREDIWVCWDCELLWHDPMEYPEDSLTFEEAHKEGYSIFECENCPKEAEKTPIGLVCWDCELFWRDYESRTLTFEEAQAVDYDIAAIKSKKEKHARQQSARQNTRNSRKTF